MYMAKRIIVLIHMPIAGTTHTQCSALQCTKCNRRMRSCVCINKQITSTKITLSVPTNRMHSFHATSLIAVTDPCRFECWPIESSFLAGLALMHWTHHCIVRRARAFVHTQYNEPVSKYHNEYMPLMHNTSRENTHTHILAHVTYTLSLSHTHTSHIFTQTHRKHLGMTVTLPLMLHFHLHVGVALSQVSLMELLLSYAHTQTAKRHEKAP